MELAKNGDIDIDKIALSNDDNEDEEESEEVKSEKVMKMARKKKRVEMSV